MGGVDGGRGVIRQAILGGGDIGGFFFGSLYGVYGALGYETARSRPFEGLGLRMEQHAAPRKQEQLHTLCLTQAV